MAYVGRGLNQEGGQYRKLDSISSNFDGSEVSFNLTIDGLEVTPTAQNLLISLGGVIQEPGTAFSVNGSTITFASAPDSSASFFGVLMGEASFIARGTVGAAEMGITAGAVTASAGVVVDSAKSLIGLNNVSASQFEGTFSGALSSSAQIADDISGSFAQPSGNVSGSSTSTGSFGKVEVGSGKITTAGNMTLDADGAQIRLEDGGTEFGRISRVSSDLVIKSISNNNDILFKGVDGSATITALTLDMSEAGDASFNNNATFGGSVTAATGTITGDFSVGGTLTAQEVHTEFESASILFTSGSTQFGNSSDDVHDFKGNTISGSVTSTGSFGSIETKGAGVTTFNGGNVGIGTNSPDSELHVVSAGSPSIRVTDTTNTVTGKFQADNSVAKIGTHTNHSLELFTNNNTALTINNSQNAELVGDLLITDNSDTPLTFKRTSNGEMFIRFLDQDAAQKGALIYRTDSNFFSLRTDNTTALSIDSSQEATFAGAVSASGNISIIKGNAMLRVEEVGGSKAYLFSGGSFSALRTVSNTPLQFGPNYDSNGDTFSLNADGSATFTGNVKVNRTADGGNSVFTIQNSAGAGSTDETAQLVFNHTNSSTLGAKITCVRADNYNTSGNQSAKLLFTVQSGGSAKTALEIDQFGTHIYDQNQNKGVLYIDSESTDQDVIFLDTASTSGKALHIDANSLTNGMIVDINSNSADNTARTLVSIINDNASANNALPFYIQNDANGKEIFTGYSDARHYLTRVRAGNGSYDSSIVVSEANRAQSDQYAFFLGQSDADGSTDPEFKVLGNGEVKADGSSYGGDADYAELFESKDGSAIAVGTSVKLDGDKVVPCSDGDVPLGVIRPKGSSLVIGNSAPLKWAEKYLRDDYGAKIYEEYTMTEWEPEEGEVYKNEVRTFKYSFQSDRIPSDVTIPTNRNKMTVVSTDENGNKLMRPKLNPNYNESLSYVEREKRDEWNVVGLLGQIPVTKGQPTGSQWIKMKDISDTVELWFVK